MPDTEQNKQTVIAFYSLAFNDKQPEEAVVLHPPLSAPAPRQYVRGGT